MLELTLLTPRTSRSETDSLEQDLQTLAAEIIATKAVQVSSVITAWITRGFLDASEGAANKLVTSTARRNENATQSRIHSFDITEKN